jgi:hypothetical protein
VCSCLCVFMCMWLLPGSVCVCVTWSKAAAVLVNKRPFNIDPVEKRAEMKADKRAGQ